MKIFVIISALVLALTLAFSARAACPQSIAPTTLVRYSTWASKANSTTDVVVIPVGTRILFDESPSFVLNKISVQGELIFEDKDLSLDIQFLLVESGGHLWIGSEDCPYRNKLTITLFGQQQVPFSVPGLIAANKVLGGFDGSKIDIHGFTKLPTWTTISATANKGDTYITLSESVQWSAGDEIVIATTDYSYNDADSPQYNILMSERRVITSVPYVQSGNRLSFEKPLEFMHYGDIWTTSLDSSVSINMRAEVGLLTRNVVIRGDITQGTARADRWGGHIFAESNTEMRIEGAELYHMGQKNNKARYPIHFHMCGTQATSYAKRNALHDTFQRAITVHGTSNLTIAENVAFNVSGLMYRPLKGFRYFIEDANEMFNLFKKNLGIDPMPHTLLTDADKRPSVFWITNPANFFEDNVAVGGFIGFWFAMPKQPTGMAPGLPGFATLYPRLTPLGSFVNNKAHSVSGDGLHIDSMEVDGSGKTELAAWQSFDWSHISPADQVLFAADTNVNHQYYLNKLDYMIKETGARKFITISNFISYRNSGFGIWGRGQQIVVTNAKLADNQIGAQFPGEFNLMEDSIIVGETDNLGNPEAFDAARMQGRSRVNRWDPSVPIYGYRHYDGGGPDTTRNLKFYNFYPMKFFFTGEVRQAAAFTVQGGNNVIAPRNKHYKPKFFNTPFRVWYENYEYNGPASLAKRGACIIDADGSLTGKCGSEIVSAYPLMYDDTCTYFSQWASYICPPGGHPHRYFRSSDVTPNSEGSTGTVFNDVEPYLRSNRSALWIHRLFDHVKQYIPATGAGYTDGTVPAPPKRDSQSINLMTNYAYLLQYGVNSETPSTIEFNLAYGQRDEWLKIAIPYPSGTTFVFDYSNMADKDSWVQVSSVAEVGSRPATYFYDESTHLLWFSMVFREESFLQAFGRNWYDTYLYVTLKATCPNSNCTQAINPATIAHARTAPPPESLCETGGGIENGDMVWSSSGGSMNVFTDAMDPAWSLSSWIDGIANITTDSAASGTSSIQADLNNYWSATFRRTDDTITISPSLYTHLEFKVRLGPGRGVLRDWIGLVGMNKSWSSIDDAKWKSVDIESPWYTNDAPIDDKHWSLVRVPVSDLGFQDVGDIFSFRFWSAESPRTTLVYFDDIKFVNLISAVTPLELAVDAPVVDPAPIQFIDPLGALVQANVQTPDTQGVNTITKTTTKEKLPTWTIAVIVVVAVVAIAALVGVVVLVIKMKSASGAAYP